MVMNLHKNLLWVHLVTLQLYLTAPSFRHAAVVNNFVVTGYQGTFQNRVQWSAVNDVTSWTAGINLADIEDLPEGGVITGITGGQYGLIFQENRITRMDYRGGAIVFLLEE